MVGNAEPGKEYNYRPLSKLCECQLDVNDQVSTKGLGREGSERKRELNSDGELETDRRPHQTLGEQKHGAPGARECFQALVLGPVSSVPRCGS